MKVNRLILDAMTHLATPVSLKKAVRRVLILLTVTCALFIAAQFPAFIERCYSGFLYKGIALLMQSVFSLFPFSLGDVFYVFMLIASGGMLFAIARAYLLKRRRQALLLFLRSLSALLILVLVFYLAWGLNYFREPAATRFAMDENCCRVDEIKQISGLLIDSANSYRGRITKADLARKDDIIFWTAENAMQVFKADPAHFSLFRPRIKGSLLTGLMNHLATAGYYNPFTAEAQLNTGMPVYLKPFTACHELSHQTGFATEDEANFSGFLASVNSSDRFFRYSAYYSGLQEFMFELRLRDTVSFKALKARISPRVLADLKNEREYWLKYRGKFGMLSNLMYDNYLRLNNQPKGLKTYNEVVRLLTGWYRQKRSFKM